MDVSHWCSKIVEEAQGEDAKVFSQPYCYVNTVPSQTQALPTNISDRGASNVPITSLYPNYTYQNAQNTQHQQAYNSYYQMYPPHISQSQSSTPLHTNANTNARGFSYPSYMPTVTVNQVSAKPMSYAHVTAGGTGASNGTHSHNTPLPQHTPTLSSNIGKIASAKPTYSSYAEYVASKTMQNNTVPAATAAPLPISVPSPPPPLHTVVDNKEKKRTTSRFSAMPPSPLPQSNSESSLGFNASAGILPGSNPEGEYNENPGDSVLSKRKQKKINAINNRKSSQMTNSVPWSVDTEADVDVNVVGELSSGNNNKRNGNTKTKAKTSAIHSPTPISLSIEEIENRKKRSARFEQERLDSLQHYREGIEGGSSVDVYGNKHVSGKNSHKKPRLNGAPIAISGGGTATLSESEIEALIVVGTCCRLEKDYFRLTSAPDPNTVRPQHILEKALLSLQKKFLSSKRLLESPYAASFKNGCSVPTPASAPSANGNAKKHSLSEIDMSGTGSIRGKGDEIVPDTEREKDVDYTYMCSQLKAIRQDLTVQHIKNEFAITVYEYHARVALICQDLNEYNQCQTQLKQLYHGLKMESQAKSHGTRDEDRAAVSSLKHKKTKQLNKKDIAGTSHSNASANVTISPCEAEFVAYRILYYIYLHFNKTSALGSSDLTHIMSQLDPVIRKAPCIRHALAVQCALSGNNPIFEYKHFFTKLYRQTPNLGVCIIDQMINVLRIQTIYRVFKAYRPHMQAQLCLRLLGYPIDEYFLYCKQYEGNNDMSRGDLPNDDIANGNAHDPSAPTTHVNIKISKKKKKPPASMNTQSVAPHPAILSIISGLLFLQSIEIKVIDASTPANASTTSALFQLDSVLIDLNPHSQLNTQEVSSIIKKINTLVDMTINTKDTIVQSACVYKKEKLL